MIATQRTVQPSGPAWPALTQWRGSYTWSSCAAWIYDRPKVLT